MAEPKMKKRRAVLTLFRSTNFGCVAQTLSSVMALHGTIVDYIDDNRRRYYESRTTNAAAKATWSTEFPLSRRIEHPDAIEHLLNQEFDEVFVGSDEILKFETEGQSGCLLSPFPTPFWLSNRVTISKILWAASVGSTDYRRVPIGVMKEAMSRLSDFSHLSVRDEHTLEFIRHGSPELAQRVEIVPDPTWLYWPRVLFDTPLKFMATNGVASSYHHLIAHLMRGRQVHRVDDRRPKTTELASSFKIETWDESEVVRKCLDCREAAWKYLHRITGDSANEIVSAQETRGGA